MASLAEVQKQVATVRAAYQAGVVKAYATGIYTSDEERKAQASLAMVPKSIDGWERRGLDAVKASSSPTGGWPMWSSQGNNILEGITNAVDIGEIGVMQALTDTIGDIPKHAKGDLKAGAGFVGEVASDATGAFLKKAWWVVLLIAGAAVGVVLLKSELTK